MTYGHDGKRHNKRQFVASPTSSAWSEGGHPGIGFCRDRDTLGCPGLLGGQGKTTDTMAGRPTRTATGARCSDPTRPVGAGSS